MKILIILMSAFALAVGFLILGIWGSMRCSTWFVDKSVIDYCTSIFSNVGISGFDAFLIGLLALALTSSLEEHFDRMRFQRDLNHKRSGKDQLELGVVFASFNSDIDLSGHKFDHEDINGLQISKILFGTRGGNSSHLEKLKFTNCVVKNMNAFGSEFIDVEFFNSFLQNCSFRRCNISTIQNDRPFLEKSRLQGVKFDEATLVDIDLHSVYMNRCSFWGAKLHRSKLPRGLFESLEATGAIAFDKRSEYWVISYRWQMFSDYRRALKAQRLFRADTNIRLPGWRLLLGRTWLAVGGMQSNSTLLDRLLHKTQNPIG